MVRNQPVGAAYRLQGFGLKAHRRWSEPEGLMQNSGFRSAGARDTSEGSGFGCRLRCRYIVVPVRVHHSKGPKGP